MNKLIVSILSFFTKTHDRRINVCFAHAMFRPIINKQCIAMCRFRAEVHTRSRSSGPCIRHQRGTDACAHRISFKCAKNVTL